MKTASPLVLLIVTVAVLTGACPNATAGGRFGTASYWACSYDPNNGVSASLTATGAVTFSVNGHCQENGFNEGVSGKLSYDPVTNRFSERLIFLVGAYENEIETTGFCAANPWTEPASSACSHQAVGIKGDFGPADTAIASGAPLAPFSLIAVPELDSSGRTLLAVQRLFADALAHASRPNPPASPVLVQAQSIPQQPVVAVRWLAPDESGDRPFTHFLVQARLSAVSGTPWITLGDVPRNAGGVYTVTYRLPDRAGFPPGWIIMACSATALAMTCSAPIAPNPPRAEYTAGGTIPLGQFIPPTPPTPKFEDAEHHSLPAGNFIPPPVPLDVRFAAWATKVTAAWKLGGTNPTVIDDYSVEENADSASQNWRRLASVPRASSRDYSTHVVRAASYSSWLRVCAERESMRSCSQPVRVTSTQPQQSLQNDRTNAFRMLIPATPAAGH